MAKLWFLKATLLIKGVFCCSTQIQNQNQKAHSANQWGTCKHWKILEKVPLVGCNQFFIWVIWISGGRVKNTMYNTSPSRDNQVLIITMISKFEWSWQYQRLTFRFRNFSVSRLLPNLWGFWFRFRKIWFRKKVSVSVSKKFGLGKKSRSRFWKIWSQERKSK